MTSQASAEMSAPRRSRAVWTAGAIVYGTIIVGLALAGLALYGVADLFNWMRRWTTS